VLRRVRRAETGDERSEGLPDPGRLVDRDLLADRQVHRQMQERVLAAALGRIRHRLRGVGVGEVAVVLGMRVDPVGGESLERRQRQPLAALLPRRDEEGADVVRGSGRTSSDCRAILQATRTLPTKGPRGRGPDRGRRIPHCKFPTALRRTP
jgi:hypothetical protein